MRSFIMTLKVGELPSVVDMVTGLVAPNTKDCLNRKNYSFCDFSIEKKMLTPNVLRFTMRRNDFDRTVDQLQFKVASELMGKDIECQLNTQSDVANSTSYVIFRGVIVSASMKGMTITCEAESNDCALQEAPKSRCFTGQKLKDIVGAIVPGASKVRIHSALDNMVFPYIVQYNESDYDFLVNLAKRFGAFFYYDEQQRIVFGKLVKPADIPELSPSEFFFLQYNLKSSNPNLRFISHNYLKDADLTSKLTDFNRNSGAELYKMAAVGSVVKEKDPWDFYLDDPNILPDNPDTTMMDAKTKAMLSSYSAEMVTCSFLTYRLDIHVGSFIKLKQEIKTGAPSAQIVTPVDNGVLVVTSSHITWDCNGSPQNEITAFILPDNGMSEDDIYAPYMDINAYPKSSVQRAVVLNNVDPLKMGRVQVKYAWQKAPANDQEKASIPWIRIAQPYGGDKDGRGFYVIPEKDEEVMVGFEHENMEKPFVIGSLYHNSDTEAQKQLPADGWCEVPAKDGNPAKNEENEVKAFRTKKGHTIEFHDTKKGDGFIRIYGNNNSDKENYDIILSTDPIKTGQNKDQDYQIKSAEDSPEKGKPIKEKEDYKAEKLRIMVRSNGGDIFLDAGNGDIIMNAKNIRFHASGNRTTLIDGKDVLKVKGEQHTFADSSSLMVQNDQTVKILGDAKETYQKSLTLEVSGDVKVSSNKNLSVETKQKTEVTANQDVKVTAKTGVEVTAKTGIELSGGTKTVLKGTKVDVSGDTNTILKGAQVTVGDDLSKTTIQGANVEFDAAIAGVRKGMWTDQ